MKLEDLRRKFMNGEKPNFPVTQDEYFALQELMQKEDCSYKDVKAFLKEHQLNIKSSDEYGRTPLHLAAQLGKTEIVQGLVGDGADVRATDTNGNTPLLMAVKCAKTNPGSAPGICDTLIRAGAAFENIWDDHGAMIEGFVSSSDNEALRDVFAKYGNRIRLVSELKVISDGVAISNKEKADQARFSLRVDERKKMKTSKKKTSENNDLKGIVAKGIDVKEPLMDRILKQQHSR